MENLSVKEMKAAMTAAGVSFADCTEKSELIARYKTAMANAKRRAAQSTPSGSAPRAPPPGASSRPPPRAQQQAPRQLRVEEMGKNADGSDGGEVGAEIRRICSSKDFYQILRVENSCKEEDLKKAYRKLAIKLHPDKCQLTGAEDAFKKVSTAFSCLNDSRQRASYDIHGEEVTKHGPGGGYHGGFGSDIDAEELFRAFCTGGKNGAWVDNVKAAVQKNPWVLLVALTILSNVIYMLEAFLAHPYLLAIPAAMFWFCPPHYRKHWPQLLKSFLFRL